MYYDRVKKVIEEFQKDKTITLDELFLMYSINQDIYNEIVYGPIFLSENSIDFVRKINKDNRNRENRNRENRKFSNQLLAYFMENSVTIYDLANCYKKDVKYIEDCFKTALNENKISQNIIDINNKRLKNSSELKMYFEFIENKYTFNDLARLHELTEYDIINYLDSTVSHYVFQSQIDEVFIINKNRETKIEDCILKMQKVGNVIATFLYMNKDTFTEKMRTDYMDTKDVYRNTFNDDIFNEMNVFYENSIFYKHNTISANNYRMLERKIKILNVLISYLKNPNWNYSDLKDNFNIKSRNTIFDYQNDVILSFIDTYICDVIKYHNNISKKQGLLNGSKNFVENKSYEYKIRGSKGQFIKI